MNDYHNTAIKQEAIPSSVSDKSLVANLGLDVAGDTVAKDISNYSNVLISGTTGSGKTSFVISLLLSLMTNYSPDRIKFVIFDSKGIDYNFMHSSGYMLTPILYDSRKFNRTAAILVDEAEKRIEVGTTEGRPDIFFIVDDYADVSSIDDVSLTMQRLLKLSRVAKIHVIMVTATPSSSIIPTEIKALIPYRIAFTTASPQASQMILGESGAERLSYPGEYILKCGGDLQKYTAICFDNPHAEIKRITDKNLSNSSALTAIAEDIFSGEEEKLKISKENAIKRMSSEPRDELTEDAIAFILKSRQASVSMLQRRFRIGYNRAARIIDEIEEIGVIGPSMGDRPRHVLLTEDEYYGKSSSQKVEKIQAETVSNGTRALTTEDLSGNAAVDYFNSLPESVRKMILEADDSDKGPSGYSANDYRRNTSGDNRVGNGVKEAEDNDGPHKISLNLQETSINKVFKFVFDYEDINTLVYHKKTLFRKEYYSIGLKKEPIAFCRELSSIGQGERRINPNDTPVYKAGEIMIKVPATPEDAVRVKQFIYNIANNLGMDIRTV